MELAASVLVFTALGVFRPRWATLLVAGLPTALAFVWLLTHEEIPGEQLGVVDLIWYAGMSLIVGAIFALATAVGIASRWAMRASSGLLSPWH